MVDAKSVSKRELERKKALIPEVFKERWRDLWEREDGKLRRDREVRGMEEMRKRRERGEGAAATEQRLARLEGGRAKE